jgi:hypothetical protein
MKCISTIAVAAGLSLAAAGSSAVNLPEGITTPLPGTTLAASPQLAGVVLEDEVQAYSFTTLSGTLSGTVQSRVVRSSVDGTLDFYWRVISDGASTGSLSAFRLGEFHAPEYNANWRLDGPGSAAPAVAFHFAGAMSSYVNFEFVSGPAGNTMTPGTGSYFMFLDTSALNYARSGIYDVTGEGNLSNLYTTFAPAVPEPATYSLLLAGLAVVGVAANRRRG